MHKANKTIEMDINRNLYYDLNDHVSAFGYLKECMIMTMKFL